jgi:hypothetical protein
MENVFADILQENAKSLHVNDALAYISKERSGVFLLIRPHETGSDVKTYGVGAQILSDLGVGVFGVKWALINTLNGFFIFHSVRNQIFNRTPLNIVFFSKQPQIITACH